MPKILVVDHHEKKRDWLTKLLVSAGHEVICASDGESGLKAFIQEKPDACIVTMTLPRVSGSDLALRLKNTARGNATPIILTSSVFKNMSLDRIAKSRWKVDAFLEEPYGKEQLLSILDKQIEDYAHIDAKDEPEAAPEEIDVHADHEDFDPFGYTASEKLDPLDAAVAAADIVSEEVTLEETRRYTRKKTGEPSRTPQAKPAPVKSSVTAQVKPITPAAPAVPELMIPVSGKLEETSFPELLASLFFARVTGILTVSSPSAEKEVWVRDGLPIHVKSDLREETLGQILRTHGIIDEEVHTRTLQDMAAGNKQQGDALVDLGALTPSQLYKALKLQTREKLLSIFAWHRGTYRFEAKSYSTKDMTVFDMWPPTIILQGVLRHYDAAGIREIVNEMKDFVLTRREDPPVRYEDLKLPSEVKEFIQLLDGRRTVAEVIRQSPFESTRTFQVLYALLVLEQFKKIDPGERSEAADELPETRISMDRLAMDAIDFPPELSEQDNLVAEAADFGDEIIGRSEPAPGALSEAEARLSEIFEKKDQESGRVAFDLDADESEPGEEDAIPEEKPEPPVKLPPRPVSTRTLPKSPSAASARSAGDLNKTIDSFIEEIVEQESTHKPDSMEETVHISLDDEFAKPQAAEEEQEHDFEAEKESLSGEDQTLLDAILADYLALPKANHYQVLHIAQNTDAKLIRDAYTAMVKKFHPDKLQGRFSAEVLKRANDVMARATEAYHELSDFKKRQAYDEQLRTGGAKKERSVQMILAAENEFNLGVSAVRQAMWAEAKLHFSKAIEMFPEEGEYHAYLGWVIYNTAGIPQNERTKEARTLMEKAIKLNPRSDKAYYFLGMLMKDCNLIEKAALMFAQAYRYNKNSIEAKNQLKAIQMLRAHRPQQAPQKKQVSTKDVLSKDISLESVKKAILKIFW